MKTGYKKKLILCLVLLLPLFLMVKCYQELHHLTRASALEEAKVRMKIQCEMHCNEYGITQQDLQGPVESPINSEVGTKDFEFTWQAPDGTEFLVVIYDNGWFVDSDWSWLNTPEDRRILAKEEQNKLIFKSVGAGELDLLDQYLKEGRPDLYTFEYGYLINHAIISDNDKAVQLLLARGADVNSGIHHLSNKMTPIVTSLFFGKCEMAILLLEAGADANAKLTADAAAQKKLGEEYHNLTTWQLYERAIKNNQKDAVKMDCWNKVGVLLKEKMVIEKPNNWGW